MSEERMGNRQETEHQVELRASRRERIATHVIAALWAATQDHHSYTDANAAEEACDIADALMAELDHRRAAELEEARS